MDHKPMQTPARWLCMSDSTDYLMAYARKTIIEARDLLQGPAKIKFATSAGKTRRLLKHLAY